MNRFRPTPLQIYVAALALIAVPVAVVVARTGRDYDAVLTSPVFWVLMACTLLTENQLITLVHRNGTAAFAPSSCFAFALMLCFGPAAALVAQLTATSLASTKRRWVPLNLVFNLSTEILIYSASAGVLAIGGFYADSETAPFGPADLPAMVVAIGVQILVTTVFMGLGELLEKGPAALRTFVGVFASHTTNFALLLAVAPIIALTVSASPLYLPLLAAPLVAAVRAFRAAGRHELRSLHDPLTGMPNRELFFDRAQTAVELACRRNTHVAVMLLDLDDFKTLNDTRGHDYGDAVLQAVTRRIGGALRSTDTLARLGGDEFAILLPDVRGRADSLEVGRKLHEALAHHDGDPHVPTAIRASIGVSCSPDDGEDAALLLKTADAAMYNAKRLGGGVALHEPADDNVRPLDTERSRRVAA